MERSRHFACSVWLFTRSDLKTIIAPSTFFAILHGLAIPESEPVGSTASPLLHRALFALLWTWINLLPFAIDNQRHPAAIAEDSINKPWRTMPSRRMTPQQAKTLMLTLYPVAVVFSLRFGGAIQCLTLILLGVWYNDFGGADQNFLVRNFINACGFICFGSGAFDVIMGSSKRAVFQFAPWFLIIWSIVFSKIQTQDMRDQAGDSLRGRKTMPLVIGDDKARWVTTSIMAFWSLFSPWVWSLPFFSSLPSACLGLTVACRSLWKRTLEADEKTFRLWNLWLVSLYFMPLLKVQSLPQASHIHEGIPPTSSNPILFHPI